MKKYQYLFFVVMLLLLLSACGGETQTSEVAIPPTTTLPTNSLTSAPIVHTMIPGEPAFLIAQLITDCTIGIGVTVGDPIILSTGCDQWTYNKIERPFNDAFQNYSPQIDISKAQIGSDDTWFFAQAITYYGEIVDPQPMNGIYSIELDLNLDGRGDILILTDQPGDEWDVAGVQVWKDIDTTVGADTPVMADDENPNGGYDEMIFDAGVGDDPDLAWARISPDDPNIAQIAFKRSLGGERDKERFSWVMWAGLIDFNPPDFDYVDTYTDTDIYDFDNTCSWTYGIQLQGLPNQCGIKVKDRPKSGPDCVQPDIPDPKECVDGAGKWMWDANACKWYCQEPPR